VLPARAKKIMIVGNHSRWEQDYVELHPELAGTIDRFKALDLKGRGWKIIPLGLAYHIGKLALIHGDQLSGPYGGGVMPSRKAADVYGNVLMGHTHSPQSFTKISPVDVEQKQMAYVCPTMGTVNAVFMRNRPNSWANGLSVVETRPDGSFNCYIIQTVKGQFSYGGAIYGAK
jgi:hypothetical protein